MFLLIQQSCTKNFRQNAEVRFFNWYRIWFLAPDSWHFFSNGYFWLKFLLVKVTRICRVKLAKPFEPNNDPNGSSVSWDRLLSLDRGLAKIETVDIWLNFQWKYQTRIWLENYHKILKCLKESLAPNLKQCILGQTLFTRLLVVVLECEMTGIRTVKLAKCFEPFNDSNGSSVSWK
jgi:hypothetical protein